MRTYPARDPSGAWPRVSSRRDRLSSVSSWAQLGQEPGNLGTVLGVDGEIAGAVDRLQRPPVELQDDGAAVLGQDSGLGADLADRPGRQMGNQVIERGPIFLMDD